LENTHSQILLPSLDEAKEQNLYESLSPYFNTFILTVPLFPLETFINRIKQKIEKYPAAYFLIDSQGILEAQTFFNESETLRSLEEEKSKTGVNLGLITNINKPGLLNSTLWDFYFIDLNFITSIMRKYTTTVFPFLNQKNKPVIGFKPFYREVAEKDFNALILQKLGYRITTMLYPLLHLNTFSSYCITFNTPTEYEEIKGIIDSLPTLDENNTRIAKKLTNVYLLKNVNIPSVIVECGFVSNSQEEKLLLDLVLLLEII
jgi:hypothetical protein